jgi:hypothetical protein
MGHPFGRSTVRPCSQQKHDPVVIGIPAPELRIGVVTDELANLLSNGARTGRYARTDKVRLDVLPQPEAGVVVGDSVDGAPLQVLRVALVPVEQAVLGVELPIVFGDQANRDQVDGAWLFEELAIQEVAHHQHHSQRSIWAT